MPLDLSDTLVIGVTTSAHFDHTEAEEFFSLPDNKPYSRNIHDR